MRPGCNSIFSSSYDTIREQLDTMILRGGSGTEFIPDISEDNLPVAVCALLVAIKEKQYREKSLLFLNQMIRDHTLAAMVEVLSSQERKDYKITTADVTLSKRKDIVAYMLSQLPNPYMHIAAVFAMGFYLTVELVEWLRPYMQHPDPWISREASYAIQFLQRAKPARLD